VKTRIQPLAQFRIVFSATFEADERHAALQVRDHVTAFEQTAAEVSLWPGFYG
jgi:hypothetical protein